eukprot:8326875-Pyramimonas_sp.AAC.1
METGSDFRGLKQHGPLLHCSAVRPPPVLRTCAVGPAGVQQHTYTFPHSGSKNVGADISMAQIPPVRRHADGPA